MAETIGSFNDFLEKNNFESTSLAASAYSIALEGLRQSIADERGITLEELHTISPNNNNTNK